MSDEAPPLPGVLGEIARIAGEAAALAIAAELGGTRVYIPANPGPDHWLTRLAGEQAARRIADHLTRGVGGLRIDLPIGPAGRTARGAARVDAMIEEGAWSERDIARATGYTIRSVRWRRARRRARDHRQPRLL